MKSISNKLKFKAMAAAFAAAVMASCAQGAEKITVDEVANHYPWDGKVDCVTTLSGLGAIGFCTYEGVFTLSVKKDGANIRTTVTNAFSNTDGTYTNTFDCAALFGAGRYPNGGIAVELVKNLGGVQLWKDGPYWAECNVGATKPEEYGYHFWWGDTVGYTREGGIPSGTYYDRVTWVSSTGTSMSSSPFDSSTCPTYGQSDSQLQSLGYIDSTGNLVATNDAATVHLGTPWRMPTSDEIQALVDHCDVTWITTNGVTGSLFTGKDEYATKSIFLPAAGRGDGERHCVPGSYGYYWSSTPSSDDSNLAWCLYFDCNIPIWDDLGRFNGKSVRPLRIK